jgi:hypothetical protein
LVLLGIQFKQVEPDPALSLSFHSFKRHNSLPANPGVVVAGAPFATTGRSSYSNSSTQSMPRLSYIFRAHPKLMWNFVDTPKRSLILAIPRGGTTPEINRLNPCLRELRKKT